MSIRPELRTPRRLEDLGIPSALVQDLTLRRAMFEGRTSSMRLSEALSLSPQVVGAVVEELRELRYFEVLGLDKGDYQLSLTTAGREQAADRMRMCRYAGNTPVSLESYSAVVRSQQANPVVNATTMRAAFADLVVNAKLLDDLGPALLAEGALFLYGPPGTGKSSIAERLNRIHEDTIVVPYAVEVDSQIITIYDPVVHQPVDEQPADLDPRWVLCRRPAVIAGGELMLNQLDLTYESGSGVYIAPLQMQANNGVFVIDDFGRQQGLTPETLLNRWIVPLDRRVDYLSLTYGLKFQIPFDVKVVFSTNREPASLGDEAFFRRIQNKILVPTMSDDEFDEVLRKITDAYGVKVEPDAPAYLRRMSREMGDGDLRPYLPKEVAKILKSVCDYHQRPLVLDKENVDRVASVYFTKLATAKSESAVAATPPAPSAASSASSASASVATSEPLTPPPPVPAGPERGRAPVNPGLRVDRRENPRPAPRAAGPSRAPAPTAPRPPGGPRR